MQGRKRCCPEDPGHPRPQAGTRKRSAAGGMERSGRSEGQYCLRSHPSNIQRRGRGAARSGKEWICKAESGVVLRTLATRGRKRVPASEAQRGGWSDAEGQKDNTAFGSPSTPKPTIPNQQPTTTNRLPQTNHHINRQQPSTNHLQATMKKRMTYKSTGLSAGLRHDSCN